MMAALADVPKVMLLTNDVDREWTAGNNALIYDTAANNPNVATRRLERPERSVRRQLLLPTTGSTSRRERLDYYAR